MHVLQGLLGLISRHPHAVAGIKGDLEVMNSRSSEEHQPTFWGA